MFLDHMDSNLFRPLASPNAKAYGIGLWALYKRLVLGQLDGDECTPKEARDTIRRELIMSNQTVGWSEVAEELVSSDNSPENDDAFRIYSYLRDCGWLMEMDDVGYRTITYFPQIAARLLSALNDISGVRSATLGATCQGVYTSLLAALANPVENAFQVEFAAKTSRDFFSDLNNIAASSREISHKMGQQKAGPALFHVFFKEFMQDLVLGDYTSIKTTSHPYRYRLSTMEVVVDILRTKSVMDSLTESLARSTGDSDRESVRAKVTNDLNDIYRIFENIGGLMDRIERYRSVMTRRTREAMQYVYRAIPDLGKQIGKQVERLSQNDFEGNEQILAPLLSDQYIAPQRLYAPRIKTKEPTPTRLVKAQPPVHEIAFGRAYDAYLKRRSENPARVIELVETAMGSRSAITTDDINVSSLDDFIAYMQLRDLIHDAVVADSAFRPLLRYYKVSPIPDAVTENAYLAAPALRIERRGLRPKMDIS